MFAGHIGAGLAIGRAEPRVNVGLFIIAALLLDIALWIFVLLGWESVTIPADFSSTHQPQYVFPWSHGLLASILWSLAAGVAGYAGFARVRGARLRVAALFAAAVFSHWLLDALVHAPELPLTHAGSAKVGLGLWQSMPLALSLEAAILLAGVLLFMSTSSLPRPRKLSLALIALAILGFTVLGMTAARAPPSAFAMAASSLGTLAVVCALAYWLGRPGRERP